MSEIASNFLDTSELTRPVWVVSDLKVPHGDDPKDYIYEEVYKGQMIKVHPNGVKKLRMSFLSARKFLANVYGLHDPFPNGGFKDENGIVHKERFGKPLRIVELTPEERESVDGLTQEDIAYRKAELEKQLSNASHKVDGAIPVDPNMSAPRRGRKPRMTESEAVEEIGINL